MKKFRDIGEIANSIDAYFNKFHFTNNYKSLTYFEDLYSRGLIHYNRGEDYLLIYEEKSDYYLLYYYISKANPVELPTSDKPEVLELAYRENKKFYKHLGKLEEIGFITGLNRINYKANLSDLKEGKSKSLVHADLGDIGFIHNSLNRDFHPYFGCIPRRLQVEEKIKNNQILLLKTEGSIAGIVEFSLNRQIVDIDHILVEPKYRGKGLAGDMLKAFIMYIKQLDANILSIWVNDDNIAAQKLYEKMDLEISTIKSKIMIKE